jgi:epoxide hydrolase-like predicted phosphatase
VAIEAVIFDIGGVLELTPPTGWQERWLQTLGLAPQEFEARLDPIFRGGSIGAITLSEVEESVASALNLGETDLRSLMDDLWREYLGTLNQPLVDYLARLRPAYRTGMLSNSFVGARERERELYGFEHVCDAVVYSHEEGSLKPHGRLYRIACDRLGVNPRQCVFLDDSEVCVDGARAVGMRAIRFTDNAWAMGELGRLLRM